MYRLLTFLFTETQMNQNVTHILMFLLLLYSFASTTKNYVISADVPFLIKICVAPIYRDMKVIINDFNARWTPILLTTKEITFFYKKKYIKNI